ncbi:MAG: serine hydrolase [Leptolyngbyaceae cyanobacterium CSU_1_4]|nr:serine hydrolase [Leptolyngbyaceae cyanobacterium CSU_1_4]
MKITPVAALERLFTSPSPQSEWFAASFLSQVPFTQVEQLLTEFQTSLGAYQSVQPDSGGYLVQFEKGKLLAQISLNEAGQIIGLLLQPRSDAIAPTQAIQQLQALPGQTNLLIIEGDTELAAHNADQPLAVGSAFKLAVLAALQEQIEKGDPLRVSRSDRSWRDVVELRPEDKSLPSGILQTWFDGALLTVQTLATLMISQSDNTATDTLIHLLGRESISSSYPPANEAFAPRNQPFLTTREAFALKNPENEALLKRYQTGNIQQKTQVLTELASAPLPDASVFDGQPVLLDVEWFFSPRELCELMQKVADLPLMSVNPGGGLVNPAQWQRVSFKGGSEPGVINLTTSLVSLSGKTYCVSATWNNPEAALDETSFLTLYSGILEGLRTQE